jgi:hypothetical protein
VEDKGPLVVGGEVGWLVGGKTEGRKERKEGTKGGFEGRRREGGT